MTLSFSEKWADGSPTYFIEKIWQSITPKDLLYYTQKDKYFKNYFENFGIGVKRDEFAPKLHTIREDKSDRWKAGNIIHPVVNNRTPKRFQFCHNLVCYSTQEIKIINYFTNGTFIRKVYIDNSIKPFYQLYPKESFLNKLNSFRMLELVKNDGFDDIESFFNFFFPNGTEGTKTLKLIHWTKLKY